MDRLIVSGWHVTNAYTDDTSSFTQIHPNFWHWQIKIPFNTFLEYETLVDINKW